MDYFYSFTDSFGCVHSVDMLYIEWYCSSRLDTLLDNIRELSLKFPSVRYDEYLERPRSSKYDFYLDSIVFGTVYLSMGKYTNYDRMTKSFDIFPMFQLRFNPNKVMNEVYFLDFIKLLMKFGKSGYIRKYDYAIDVPLSPKGVKVFFSRKEYGLYKGTRYYGQSGRHNYLKIYDKQKEVGEELRSTPLTRIEYTFLGGQIPSFEKVYILDSALIDDLSSLNDTDRAIVEMYNTLLQFGFDFDLKLGRGKMEKLSKYLYGAFHLLDYGDFLNKLLDYIKAFFNLCDCPDNAFIPFFDDELPFD